MAEGNILVFLVFVYRDETYNVNFGVDIQQSGWLKAMPSRTSSDVPAFPVILVQTTLHPAGRGCHTLGWLGLRLEYQIFSHDSRHYHTMTDQYSVGEALEETEGRPTLLTLMQSKTKQQIGRQVFTEP